MWLPLQPANKETGCFKLTLKRFKINIAEAKKVSTFAVPKQTGAEKQKRRKRLPDHKILKSYPHQKGSHII